jgi:transposase
MQRTRKLKAHIRAQDEHIAQLQRQLSNALLEASEWARSARKLHDQLQDRQVKDKVTLFALPEHRKRRIS